jgi:hypothetical protein
MLQVERLWDGDTAASAAVPLSWPELMITFQGRRWPKVLRRPVTIVGKQRPSFLRLHGARLGACHAALIAEGGQMWVLGLQPPDLDALVDPVAWQLEPLQTGESRWLGAAQATLCGWVTASPRPIFGRPTSISAISEDSDESLDPDDSASGIQVEPPRNGPLLNDDHADMSASGLALDEPAVTGGSEVLTTPLVHDAVGSDVWREIVADVAANAPTASANDRRWMIGPSESVSVQPLERTRPEPRSPDERRAIPVAPSEKRPPERPAHTSGSAVRVPPTTSRSPASAPRTQAPEQLTDQLTKRLQHRQRMRSWPRYTVFGGLILLTLIAAFWTIRTAWYSWLPH